MTIFGDWLRERARRIARATAGDKRAAAQLEAQDSVDPLGVDLEATRQALEASIRAEEHRRIREALELAQERKEQSILAALVFGCSCGSRYIDGAGDPRVAPSVVAWERANYLPAWLRIHTRCAGLGAMVREDA